ncbi:hypothetical protein [Oceanobacillus indicireducens]|uniref:hypothetical protein n=1 Tax=Oceanobacillus indicireducens TaxID=1004261 RepID=UPI001668A17A|nr:hypothetical protein [Oceanobacillus indicireducens]
MRKNILLSSIFLLLGFSLLVLILVHYYPELSFRPDPEKVGIFNRIGIQVRYPFLVGVLSFIFVIALNRINSLFFRNLGIIGLIALLTPFILIYLFNFISSFFDLYDTLFLGL